MKVVNLIGKPDVHTIPVCTHDGGKIMTAIPMLAMSGEVKELK